MPPVASGAAQHLVKIERPGAPGPAYAGSVRPRAFLAALAAASLLPACSARSPGVSPPADAVVASPAAASPSGTPGQSDPPAPRPEPTIQAGASLVPRGPAGRLLRLPGAQDLPRAIKGARPSGPMILTQANLYTGMTAAQFASDLATVIASEPDFVTLSETYRRTPGELTPPGYDAYRADAPRDARETPVLWRTDRWRRVDSGTFFMHARQVRWGTRYVNWVTLEEISSGARVSVISAHASPGGVGREGLLAEFLARLDLLAGELEQRGPVLIGSDLNTYYERSPFLGTSFPSSGAVTTFDVLGEPAGGWATGDGGRTIDYIFTAGEALAVRHSTAPLANSDHRMLTAVVDVLPGG